jgi:hypothetical protein
VAAYGFRSGNKQRRAASLYLTMTYAKLVVDATRKSRYKVGLVFFGGARVPGRIVPRASG